MPATAPSASLLQRKVGWSDASKQGKAWNADERAVGKIRRIPLEGLAEGLDASVKGAAGRKIPQLSSEGATGKAIVLVPAALDATGSIEVVVFLHGFTEGIHRPYAGYRQLVDPKPSTDGLSDALKERLRACARASTRPTPRRSATSRSTRWSSSWRRAVRRSS